MHEQKVDRAFLSDSLDAFPFLKVPLIFISKINQVTEQRKIIIGPKSESRASKIKLINIALSSMESGSHGKNRLLSSDQIRILALVRFP